MSKSRDKKYNRSKFFHYDFFIVAIVTGGNKGIGLGIVKTLLENNYKVVTCGRSEFKDIKLFKDLEFIKVDAKDFNTHQKLVDHAINSLESLTFT